MLVDLILSTALSQEDYKRHCGSRDKRICVLTAERVGIKYSVNQCRSLATTNQQQYPPSALQAVLTIGELLQHIHVEWVLSVCYKSVVNDVCLKKIKHMHL